MREQRQPLYVLLYIALLLGIGITSAKAEMLPFGQTNSAPDQYVTLDVVADKDAAVPGETLTIGFRQNIYPKWHTYFKNPGDSGEPTRVHWDIPQEITTSPLVFPIPDRQPYEILVNFGYSDTAYFTSTLTLPETLSGDILAIKGEMTWLVCHDICIPEKADFALNLPIRESAAADNAMFFETAAKAMPQESASTATLYRQGKNLVIAIDNAPFSNVKTAEAFPLEWGLINNTTDFDIQIENGRTLLTTVAGDRDPSELSISDVLIKTVSADGSVNGYMFKTTHNAPVVQAVSGMEILLIILSAILGGMILNLMPCVFPILSLKALSLTDTKGKARRDAIAHGVSYTAGILISFAVIAGLLIYIRHIGKDIGWGFQLQDPVTVSLLAILMFLIGLNLSGLFTITGKFTNVGSKLSSSSGHTGSFFTGVLATLVATPCSAPFMAGAIGFAVTQPPLLSMVIFLSVGFGLALPYLALTLSSTVQRLLPKPGAWMERFKQFLAFPMYLTAAWLIWVLGNQKSIDDVFIILIAMTLITMVFWWMKSKSGLMTTGLVIAIIAGALYTMTSKFEGIEILEYSPSALETALKGDDPVFVNMTADWCITCKYNERVTIKTAKTAQLFDAHNVQYLVGDWTLSDPLITQYLSEFNVNGVPLYVIYPARDENGARPDAVKLPQFITHSTLKDTLEGQY